MAESPTPAHKQARGYSWPPFEEGNAAALTHGARSERRVAPLAQEYGDDLAQVAPWTASAAFDGARGSWAWAEAQAHLLRSYLAEKGHFDTEGEELSAVRTLDRVEARLIKLRAALGLDPASLARILAGAAAVASATGDDETLEALAAEGARILRSRHLTAGTEGPTTEETNT